MKYFDHEKLDVYQASIELVILIDEIIDFFPRGRSYLADQLQRAGSSISLNIAEGAGEYSAQEKIRFYRMARRSATECASIFDIGQRIRIIEHQRHLKGRELLIRIVSMLTKMVQGNSKTEVKVEEGLVGSAS
ncbi:MAG TPA: four helix bundle protein [Rhabdochlamydiaceae bacterium]|nr:four helix bundle protein [Rhabdochlamydiaceae bacterium]